MPFLQNADGRDVRVMATAAHVCRAPAAALDICVGTKLRVPGELTGMDEANCAPLLASWIAHTDAPEGALQVGVCLHPFQGLQGKRRSTSLESELAASCSQCGMSLNWPP